MAIVPVTEKKFSLLMTKKKINLIDSLYIIIDTVQILKHKPELLQIPKPV